jgi:hypothetical protein
LTNFDKCHSPIEGAATYGGTMSAMKPLYSFGDGINDLNNVKGMREATIRGMEWDLKLFGEGASSVGDRRLEFR